MVEWAVVTGGSRGIGAAVARMLRSDGIRVLVVDRQAPTHDEYDDFVELDLSAPELIESVVGPKLSTVSATKLIHCAGIVRPRLLEDCDIGCIEDVFAVNVRSLIELARLTVPTMRDQGAGRIVAIGSRAALGKPSRTGYSASKAALTGLVRTWTLELAPFGITSNVVAPGPTDTELFRASNEGDEWLVEDLEGRIPVGFMAAPEDIAAVVRFLCSPAAKFVTGQVINACGGTSIGFVEWDPKEVGATSDILV